jgi:ParB family chromosome partitioning protein
VGKSRAAVTNTLRLLGLPPGVQRLLTDGRLSAGHARALLGTPDRARQEALAQRAVDEGWTVRAVENAIRGATESDDPSADNTSEPLGDGAGISPLTRLRPPGLLEIEKLLAERLNTRVSISMGARKGRVSIEFADLADLERIYDAMLGASDS